VLEQPAAPPQHVVYFDLEMTEADLVERLTDLGYGPGDDLGHLHYYLLPNLPPLDTAEGGRAVERIVTAHQADLVVLDTTSRVVAGAENDADTFRAFYRHTGQRLKAAGITYVRLDHAGKDIAQGQRGSSAKADDVDVVWEMTAADGAVKLKATHARMSWVDRAVVLARQTEPLLRHVRTQRAWQAGCTEAARDLDDLELPVDVTVTAAQEALREAGKGSRRAVVADAVRWRKERRVMPAPTDSQEF
jgi:RecA-family ATPase